MMSIIVISICIIISSITSIIEGVHLRGEPSVIHGHLLLHAPAAVMMIIIMIIIIREFTKGGLVKVGVAIRYVFKLHIKNIT